MAHHKLRINVTPTTSKQEAKYTSEPIWRSPFTLAILSWISVAIGILGLFPVSKILGNTLNILKGKLQATSDFSVQAYSITFAILAFIFILFFSLRRIAKKQTRVPLILNYAISGYGRRLTLEKIHIDGCPQCGGEMKYYNKPVEWREVIRSDGTVKREVTKKIPALECKRNSEHCYRVDPAEDKINCKSKE